MHARSGLILLLICVFGHHSPSAGDAVPEPLVYYGICDASGAVPIGRTMFAVADDEMNQIRVYRRDRGGLPVRVLDLSAFLGVDPRSPESDLEAGARIGHRAYWISSHDRNRRGRERLSRHRFFATDIKGSGDDVELVPVGQPYRDLLDDLLRDPKLKTFDLAAASTRAPNAPGGLNIEGLCPTPENHLLIGFRNPIPQGRALLVPLLNPDEVIEGHPARFGEAIRLNLGGLGIRDLAFWHGKYLISAGPYDGQGHFRLYEWAGGQVQPRHLRGIRFDDLHPEAIIVYPDKGLAQVQLLSDDGTRMIDGCPCKELPESQKRFRSVWVALKRPR
ncbi:MAG: DUF3616 domain-containing protein [Limisphaerales bacterium]